MGWLRENMTAVAPLPASLVGLLLIYDLPDRPVVTFVLFGLALGSFAFVWRRWEAASIPGSVLLAIAVLLRLMALPLPATLSNDVYRYLWDGKVTREGFNPYVHAPDDEALEHLRDDLWRRLDHLDVETVYPPLAIGLFSIASMAPRPVLALKGLLTLADLLCCLLLLRLARRRGLPSGRTLAYAWNPLVVIEVAGMGHVDVLGVAPLLGAALWLGDARRGRGLRVGSLPSLATGAGLALGVLAKLAPLLLVPAWFRHAPRRWLLVASCVLLMLMGVAPFLSGLHGLPPGLTTYGVSWEFNGPLFEPLWRILDATGTAPWLKARLDDLKQVTGWHATWNRFYPWVYPQLLAKLLLAMGLAGVVLSSLRLRDPVESAHRVFSGLLVFSATVYPWYLLWMLPWAALLGRTAWLVLSGSVLFAYLPLLFGVALFPWSFLLIWTPWVVAMMLQRRSD